MKKTKESTDWKIIGSMIEKNKTTLGPIFYNAISTHYFSIFRMILSGNKKLSSRETLPRKFRLQKIKDSTV